MSVVLDMSMPKTCKECPLSYETSQTDELGYKAIIKLCCFTGFEICENGRLDDCPIICELPEGHGDLVDYDEMKNIASGYGAYAEAILSHIQPKIIIEAEVRENETH